jgi:hypothetical protein
MTNKRKTIPNPLTLSVQEESFIKASSNFTYSETKKNTFKGRMISMSDNFYDELNNFLKENPTEGNRSSFIVRVVAEYMQNKKKQF